MTTDIRQHILDTARPLMLRKGYTAVGLTELLAAAAVPKGSFYHYFASKEAFGEALLDAYFTEHLAFIDTLLRHSGPAGKRLLSYFEYWLDSHASDDPDAKCLAVKLSAEVSDLSDSMRGALERGTQGIIGRVAGCIAAARADGSLPPGTDATVLATTLYQLWVGASILAKVRQGRAPLDIAMAATRQLLQRG